MRFFKTFVASVLMFCVGSVGLLASGVASAADFSNHKVAVITFSLLHNREHGNPDPQEGKTVSNTEVIGNLIAEDIENCSIYNDDNSTVIAVVGVKDLNIINSNNVILIANKDKMGELPNLIEKIKCDKEFKKYL